MNKDLHYILHGQVPRAYGEMPKSMGNYERLCPSEQSETYLKLIGGQKMFGTQIKVSEKLTLQQKEKVRGPGSMPVFTDKNEDLGLKSAAKVPLGGQVSAVTVRKQQHQINLAEISSVSQHRPLVKP